MEVDSPNLIRPKWVWHNFHEDFWRLVMSKNGNWVPVPVGAPREDAAPMYLQTQIRVHYTQELESYCMCYSLASALHYMGLEDEASKVALLAEGSINLPRDKAIKYLRDNFVDIAPCIGMYQAFGKVINKRKPLSISSLIHKRTPYPTIVIPTAKDGGVNHAVCVVDDLIFDATQGYALTLTHKSFHWICGDCGSSDYVLGAMRFDRPSRGGLQRLDRKVVLHESAI